MNIFKNLNFSLVFLLFSMKACRTPLETEDQRSYIVLPTLVPPDLDIMSHFIAISEQSSLIIWTINEILSASLAKSGQLHAQIETPAKPSGVRNPLDFLRQIASEVGVARAMTWEDRPLWRWQSLSARRLLGSDLYIFCQPLDWMQRCSIGLSENLQAPVATLLDSSLLKQGSLSLDLLQLTKLYQNQSRDRLQWPDFPLVGRLDMTRNGDIISIKGDKLGWKSQAMNLQAETFVLDISIRNRSFIAFELVGTFLKSQGDSKLMKISIQTKKSEKKGMELTFDLE